MLSFDIFNDDAFSLTSLVAAINEVEHVPGRAGALAFAGAGEGVSTTSVAFERIGDAISLVPASARGGPAPKQGTNKGTLRNLTVPHIKIEDTVQAASVLNVRAFGSTDQLRGVQSVVNGQFAKMGTRLDLTLEHLRLGAIKGIVMDADGTTKLADLFETFQVLANPAVPGVYGPKVFDFDLANANSDPTDFRQKCQELTRWLHRNAKIVIPSTAKIWAFCGDAFFDAMIARSDVKATYLNTEEQRARVGGNYAFGVFEYGGIVWENYRGTDDGEDADGGTVGIAQNEARFFLTGVPGLYAEYFAPATFMETVGTIGLPRYAKLAPDTRFNESVELHTQMNPLPVCLRPQTLVKGLA